MQKLKKSNFIIYFIFFILFLFFLVYSFDLNNWRFPYYVISSKLENYQSSKSGMFWDDIKTLNDSIIFSDLDLIYNKSLSDYWYIEPQISGLLGNVNEYFSKNYFLNGILSNNIKFKNFFTRQVVITDSRYYDDPLYPWLKNRGISARFSEAFLQFNFNCGFLRAGRINRNWSPFADRSLILSNYPYSYDGFELALFSNFFEFRHFFTAFPQENISLDLDIDGYSRYLTAHSLNFILGKFGSIGFSESVVFTRKSGFPDIQYINPVSVYFTTNTNGEGSGNLMLCTQWKLHPFTDKIDLLGQILLDDIQVDNNGPQDMEPNHWAGDFGIVARNILPLNLKHAFSLEYRYCSRWLYTVSDNCSNRGERYTYLGKSLGYPLNDSDSLNLSFLFGIKKQIAANADFFYSRIGENRTSSYWNDTKDSTKTPGALGYRIEPKFPSGVVQRTIGFNLEARTYFKGYADASIKFCNRWIENQNNITNPFKYSPIVSASISVHYPLLLFNFSK
jgi:hypothetical protein